MSIKLTMNFRDRCLMSSYSHIISLNHKFIMYRKYKQVNGFFAVATQLYV